MNENLLRELARDFLLPLFSGARIEAGAQASTPRQSRVAFTSQLSIGFKVEANDNYRLVITRSQPFLQSQADRIPEIQVVQAFVDTLKELRGVIESDYRDDVLPSFQRRVISKALVTRVPAAQRSAHERAVLKTIDQLSKWGERLYEGSPISAAIGLRLVNDEGVAVHIDEVGRSDFGPVLSNGHDTMMMFNFNGRFLSHEPLSVRNGTPSFCPLRQAGIAEWTTGHERRIAFSLNRLGEILVFQDHKMVFARRSGRWHFLTHSPVIKQMNVPRDENLRVQIYETCLDTSFARTGGCIGVVQVNRNSAWREIVAPGDLITSSSIKAKALRRTIAGRRFQELDRTIRQEIAAIDGATVISHQGEILAAGAILRIAGGSTGGGRLAAAKALSAYGLGIKISQDGGITGYRPEVDEPAFRIM